MENLKELSDIFLLLFPERDFSEISEESYLIDYGIRSIQVLSIILEYEKRKGIIFSVQKLAGLRLLTVGDIISVTGNSPDS